MEDEKLTRRDVDKLSAQILVNFGLVNSAALAAALAKLEGFYVEPFAIGLIATISSQIVWYMSAALEEALGDDVLSHETLSDVFNLLTSIFVIVGGGLSGGCIVYGCFILMKFTAEDALWYSGLLCGTPIVILIAIAIGKAIEEVLNEKQP